MSLKMSTSLAALAALCVLAMLVAEGQGSELRFRPEPQDLETAATGHHGHGRVHIKVYRGPSDGHHASHGYWVKQPADDDRH